MNPPTVLVTGATGTVGGVVARLLAADQGVQVRAATRTPTADKAVALRQAGAEIVPLDLDRPETLAPALAGADRALLLTGYSVDMLRQSKRFLDAAKTAGVGYIVHVGASGAPTNEVAHWGWHQFVEAYIERLGFSFTHLRPESFMQNLTGFGWLRGDELTCYIGKNTRWSWVDGEDLARAAAACLQDPGTHAGQTYPLGYDAKSFAEIATFVSEVRRRPVRVVERAPDEFLAEALRAGGDPAYLGRVHHQLQLNAAGAIPEADRTFDNFQTITGRAPCTWRDFVRREFA